MKKNEELSSSMEDYLEAIYNLQRTDGQARVKDIANSLGVTMASVNGAVRTLCTRGLASHNPYESVQLTGDGEKLAREIVDRHDAVKEFLTSILGLEEKSAEEEACKLEHAIRPETLERLIDFIASYKGQNSVHQSPESGYAGGFRGCRRAMQTAEGAMTLAGLCPGNKAAVIGVTGRGPVRRRLIEMGLTPSTEVEVLRCAPFGDPIEIRVRGYLLSLRRSEAERVQVEVAS